VTSAVCVKTSLIDFAALLQARGSVWAGAREATNTRSDAINNNHSFSVDFIFAVDKLFAIENTVAIPKLG
jgi:hypothetical protein